MAEVIFFTWKPNIPLFFKVILILPLLWLLNLGSNLSIDNIVWLDLADTNIASQDAANKVLELMEKWKYQTSEVNSNFFYKFVGNMIHHCNC